MIYYDLIIKAEDGNQPSSREQYMEAARAQKLVMGVHCAEWDLTCVKGGYPTTIPEYVMPLRIESCTVVTGVKTLSSRIPLTVPRLIGLQYRRVRRSKCRSISIMRTDFFQGDVSLQAAAFLSSDRPDV